MSSDRPRPLAELPDDLAQAVLGVLTDIDDTLTSAGVISVEALGALGRLRAAGLHVIAVTGRPLGWSEPYARSWPIDAIVAENGAVAIIPCGNGLKVEYAQDQAMRARNAKRLAEVAAQVLREVPGSQLARDSAGRATDIAIDHAEFTHLSDSQVRSVVALMRAEGMSVTVSSIHVNGWFGEHTKWSGARWAVKRVLGRELEAEIGRWVYVGDSPNDETMFGHFPLSVGVANLMSFEHVLGVWPAYLSHHPRGAGFADVAQRLLGVRPVSGAFNS